MELPRKINVLIGAVLLVSVVIILNQESMDLSWFLYPVWFLLSPIYPYYTIAFILTYFGLILILYAFLESDVKHSWMDLLQNLLPLYVLFQSHLIMRTAIYAWTGPKAHYLIVFDGFLVIFLAFMIPRLRVGSFIRQVVFWVYIVSGIVILLNSGWPALI